MSHVICRGMRWAALLLALITGGVGAEAFAQAQPDAPRRVLLGRQASVDPDRKNQPRRMYNHLYRELPRQALLMTAREELGLQTRDATLLEPLEAGDGPAVELEMTSVTESAQGIDVRLWRKGQPTGAVEFFIENPEDRAMTSLRASVERYEKLSRAGYLEALRGFGLTKTAPLPALAEGEQQQMQQQAEALLGEWNFWSQFRAVRLSHELLRREPNDSEHLRRLAMGYAHLGVMTRRHLNASHVALNVRAMLYAQRWLARDADNALAHATRAYAFSLSGWHSLALDDLKRAGELHGKQPLPDWAQWAKAYAEFDREALRTAGEGGAFLPRLLLYLTWEHVDLAVPMDAVAEQLLEENPEAYRVIDGLQDEMGVSRLHALSQLGPAVLMASLPERLAQVEGLPAAAAQWLKQNPQLRSPLESFDPARLLKAAATADAIEPSIALLGTLVEETLVAQLFQRAHFIRFQLGTSAAPLTELVVDRLAPHPLTPLMRAYGQPDWSRSQAVLKEITPPDLTPAMRNVIKYRAALGVDGTPLENMWALTHQGVSSDAEDLAWTVTVINQSERGIKRFWFSDISPNSPWRYTLAVRHNWEKVRKKKADQWLKQFGHFPQLKAALATQWAERDGAFDKANPLFEELIRDWPSGEFYQQLAYNYLKMGDEARFLSTLEESLALPDLGLRRSHTNAYIARYLMNSGRPARARPYAIEAAGSYSAASLMVAAHCHEMLGELDKADAYYGAIYRRYPDVRSAFAWWNFRKQWDRPNQAAAQQAFESHRKSAAGDVNSLLAVSHLVAGDREAARAALAARKGQPTTWQTCVLVGLGHLELGEVEDGMERLNLVASESSDWTARQIAIELLAAGERKPVRIDAQRWREITDKVAPYWSPVPKPLLDASAAWFYRIHGEPELAREHAALAMRSTFLQDPEYAVARWVYMQTQPDKPEPDAPQEQTNQVPAAPR